MERMQRALRIAHRLPRQEGGGTDAAAADPYDPLAASAGVAPSGTPSIAQRAVDWWQSQPSWLEQARAVREQSDPTSLRPTPAEIEFASGMVGPAATKVVGPAGAALKAEKVAARTAFPARPDPTPAELAAARADTRVSGDIVGQRLDKIVPDSQRVVGGSYTPGAPGGGKWSDLSEEFLSRPGPGFKVTDEELQKLWQESVAASSQAAKNAVAVTKAAPKFAAKDWDAAMRLPMRDMLWYELSGENSHHNLPELTPAEHVKHNDLLGATSAQAEPQENAERTLGTLSQYLRGVPVDVDLTQPVPVRRALSRPATGYSALPGNKTGNFSDTLTLTGGVPTRYPISVNDVWVGKMFGITEKQLTENQSLHEPMAIYHNKVRDLFNERHQDEVGFPLQSWNFQAPSWVKIRGGETGDAYYQVWPNIIAKLNAAGIPGINGNVISRQALLDPRFADALRTTTGPFRAAPKATVEMGTTQTNTGSAAHGLYQRAINAGDEALQNEYLKPIISALYHSGRGEYKPWDMLKRAITGLPQTKAGITRFSYPTQEYPLDVGGTFEGAVSPNIRIPLKDMTDEQIAHFNAIAGKHLQQDAMAASVFRSAEEGTEPAAGHVRTHSLFVPTTEAMEAADIRSLAQAMAKEGHGMSYERYPNGYEFGVIPRFGEEGVKGADAKAVDRAYDASLAAKFGPDPIIRPHDFKSVYTEAKDYGRLRIELVTKIKNEFLQEAVDAGLNKDQARLLTKGGGSPDALTGRAKSAWLAYGSRLRDLAGAEKSFGRFAEGIAKAHADFIPKAEGRLSKKGFAGGGRVTAADMEVRRRLADPRVKAVLNAKHKIDRDHDVPYVAGISNDLKTLYQDRRFVSDKDLDELLWLHEAGEAVFIDLFGDEYLTAHRLITLAEKAEVERRGMDWSRYKRYFEGWSERLEKEPVRNVPRDLFLRPYEDSGDKATLRRIHKAMGREAR